MKKLTKAQRREIYLDIANDLATDINQERGYLCHKLIDAAYSYIDMSVLDTFPEFAKFKPNLSFYLVWFLRSESDFIKPNLERVTCMLLCAEMCK